MGAHVGVTTWGNGHLHVREVSTWSRSGTIELSIWGNRSMWVEEVPTQPRRSRSNVKEALIRDRRNRRSMSSVSGDTVYIYIYIHSLCHSRQVDPHPLYTLHTLLVSPYTQYSVIGPDAQEDLE